MRSKKCNSSPHSELNSVILNKKMFFPQFEVYYLRIQSEFNKIRKFHFIQFFKHEIPQEHPSAN